MENGLSNAGEAWFGSAFLTAVVERARTAPELRGTARKSAREDAVRTMVYRSGGVEWRGCERRRRAQSWYGWVMSGLILRFGKVASEAMPRS